MKFRGTNNRKLIAQRQWRYLFLDHSHAGPPQDSSVLHAMPAKLAIVETSTAKIINARKSLGFALTWLQGTSAVKNHKIE